MSRGRFCERVRGCVSSATRSTRANLGKLTRLALGPTGTAPHALATLHTRRQPPLYNHGGGLWTGSAQGPVGGEGAGVRAREAVCDSIQHLVKTSTHAEIHPNAPGSTASTTPLSFGCSRSCRALRAHSFRACRTAVAVISRRISLVSDGRMSRFHASSALPRRTAGRATR